MPEEEPEQLQLNGVSVEQFPSNATSEITLVIEGSASEATTITASFPSLKYDRDIDDGSVEVIPSKTTSDTTIIKPTSPFPSLEYDIASKKRSILISACLVFIVNGLIPGVLYYILQYGSTVSRDTVINVVEISATSTTLQWPWRLWVLLRRDGERAPVNRTFLTWDVFQCIRDQKETRIEDLTACDGGAGQAYRERLDIRWQSSPLFQKLLMDITLVSGIAVLIQTGLQFIILFATPEIVFVALSTVVLWGSFGLTLLWGWKFAERGLQEERDKWEECLIEGEQGSGMVTAGVAGASSAMGNGTDVAYMKPEA
ncbi:hypothetical protein Clacol_001993 [Clathrus columnatus]|uniref:Uncharacterized protein n=1 Tax=Clathrus columnatus TaxID=1419009 RepID=A0AAV5A2R9_9AGAM|nr:hypothetical protein Clacol_001993 [Clathrus columnatus]